MKFVVFASLIASALAVPAELAPRTGSSVCSRSLYSNPLCCATDILGIIGIDCDNPSETPRDARNFRDICARKGQQSLCCVAPVASQALLCTNVVG